ncbi:MAG: thiamine diphosphokinase [Treponema sp.]|jgi:thiamine pyrophosphokinase|nr:thiamine diphosphokinase [Treponema sp.]
MPSVYNIKGNGGKTIITTITHGIAFIGGECLRPEQCRRLLASVLERQETRRSLLVVAADSGLIAAEAAGIAPDWIVGDMDSLDTQARLARYPPERVIRYPVDKDYTDTELALALLWEQGAQEIWLIGGGGGRLDHLFAIRTLFERERCPDRWITRNADSHCLREQQQMSLSLPRGSLVSLFPLGEGPWNVRSLGLKWPLDGLRWDRGFFSLSNVAETGDISVYVDTGRFLVIDSHEDTIAI